MLTFFYNLLSRSLSIRNEFDSMEKRRRKPEFVSEYNFLQCVALALASRRLQSARPTDDNDLRTPLINFSYSTHGLHNSKTSSLSPVVLLLFLWALLCVPSCHKVDRRVMKHEIYARIHRWKEFSLLSYKLWHTIADIAAELYVWTREMCQGREFLAKNMCKVALRSVNQLQRWSQ